MFLVTPDDVAVAAPQVFAHVIEPVLQQRRQVGRVGGGPVVERVLDLFDAGVAVGGVAVDDAMIFQCLRGDALAQFLR